VKRKEYYLKEIVFHSPAEHLVNGVRFALEIQLHHISKNNERLSIAVFGMETTNDFISPPIRSLSTSIQTLLTNDSTTFQTPITSFNPAHLLPQKEGFWFYEGSLTSPPCDDHVKWIVMHNPVNVTGEFMGRVRRAVNERYFGGNARNAQVKLFGFEVKVFSNPNQSGNLLFTSNLEPTKSQISQQNQPETSTSWNVIDIAKYWKESSRNAFESADFEQEENDWKVIAFGRSEEKPQFTKSGSEVLSSIVDQTIFQSNYDLAPICSADYTLKHKFQSFTRLAQQQNNEQNEANSFPAVAPGSHLFDYSLQSKNRQSVSDESIRSVVEQAVISNPEVIHLVEQPVQIIESKSMN